MLQELPTDYMRGLDFNIKKTSKGGYADYSTSNWSRRETALTEAEQAAIDAHGLFNLADFLPKKPSESELRVIKEMFDASVEGKPYDADKWGAYYRPFGLEAPAGVAQAATHVTETSTLTVSAKAPVVEDEETEKASEPVVVPKSTSSDKAQDILAMIRARQQKG